MKKNSEELTHLTNDVRPHREDHWLSIYHQLSIPICLDDVETVLEFGPGRGLMGAVMKHYGMNYSSADVVDMGAKPDFLSSIKEFPSDKNFDLVCAFQALEHNPPEEFIPHLEKMRDIANKYVYVSLPYYGRWIVPHININLPRVNRSFVKFFMWDRFFPMARPIEKYRKSETPYSHHWFEIGDKGFSKKDVAHAAKNIGLKQIKSFHSSSLPYHYFILFEKIDKP